MNANNGGMGEGWVPFSARLRSVDVSDYLNLLLLSSEYFTRLPLFGFSSTLLADWLARCAPEPSTVAHLSWAKRGTRTRAPGRTVDIT